MPYILIGELKRYKISQTQLAKLLGITANSVNQKLKGIRDFTATEMYLIRDSLFPEKCLDELFRKY